MEKSTVCSMNQNIAIVNGKLSCEVENCNQRIPCHRKRFNNFMGTCLQEVPYTFHENMFITFHSSKQLNFFIEIICKSTIS